MSRVGSSRLVPRALGFAAGNFGGGFSNFNLALADPGLDFGNGTQGGVAFLGGIDVGCNPTGSPLGGGLSGSGLSGGNLSGGVNHDDGVGAGLGGSSILDFGTGL